MPTEGTWRGSGINSRASLHPDFWGSLLLFASSVSTYGVLPRKCKVLEIKAIRRTLEMRKINNIIRSSVLNLSIS